MSVKLPNGILPQYEKFIIKEYQYWVLLLNEDQRYLGRSIVWLRRPGEMQDLFEIHPQEEFELFRIGSNFKSALKKLWQPDLMNYPWLGNFIHEHGGHGHMHLIPRYKEKRDFASTTFTDGRWGQNYAPYTKHRLHDDILAKIRDAIRETLSVN